MSLKRRNHIGCAFLFGLLFICFKEIREETLILFKREVNYYGARFIQKALQIW